MRLAILTQYYPPETGAPQARLSDLARRFIAHGHSVRVVTALPNYPIGRVFDGYRTLARREERDGVHVLRAPLYPTQSVSMLPRMTSYLSFAASAAAIGAPFIGRVDYLLTESPPLFLGPVGWMLSRAAGARFIFNVSDLWPESAAALGAIDRASAAFKAAEALEAFCYRRAWLVTGQSASIVENIEGRFPGIRTWCLSNGVDVARFDPRHASRALRASLGSPDEFVVVYAGLHGIAQGLEQLVDAAEALREDRVRVVLVGDGGEKRALQARAAARRLTNVTFLPSRPYAEIAALLASADAIAVTLKTDIPGAVPSKLYEAMASGRPVVLVAAGEPAAIAARHSAACVVAPGDRQGLVSALKALRACPAEAAAMGTRARAAAEQHFNREAIGRAFIEHLESSLLS